MHCSNFDCMNPVKRHLRCALCRRKNICTCAVCGDNISNYGASIRAIKCKQCIVIVKGQYMKLYTKKYNAKISYYKKQHLLCVVCVKPLPKGAKKYCCIPCRTKAWTKRWRKRKHNECVVCFKDISESGRFMTCSIECYVDFRRHYCNVKQDERRRKMTSIALSS